jgi:monoamine oxidase
MATAIRDRGGALHLGMWVTGIEQTATSVRVRLQDCKSGSMSTVSGDRCVCTLPFPVLRDRVELRHAGLDAQTLRSIGELQMMPAGRIHLQTHSRFWRQEGVEGLQLAGTDTILERIWNSSNVQPGASGMIHSYVQLHNAVAMSQIPAADRLKLVSEQIASSVFPELRSAATGLGVAKLWNEDPLAGGGAWLIRKPDPLGLGSPRLGQAEGRIHFAGEHTASAGGWMQSAIESGQRAALEVMAAG